MRDSSYCISFDSALVPPALLNKAAKLQPSTAQRRAEHSYPEQRVHAYADEACAGPAAQQQVAGCRVRMVDMDGDC